MNYPMNIYVNSVSRRYDTLGEGLVDLVRATIGVTAGLYRSVQTELKRRALKRKLETLNDHLLKDIGLTRSEISEYVEQQVTGRLMPAGQTLRVQRAVQIASVAWRSFKTWQNARLTARELRRLDHKLLTDIGLQSSDIDCLARNLAERTLGMPIPANDNQNRAAA